MCVMLSIVSAHSRCKGGEQGQRDFHGRVVLVRTNRCAREGALSMWWWWWWEGKNERASGALLCSFSLLAFIQGAADPTSRLQLAARSYLTERVKDSSRADKSLIFGPDHAHFTSIGRNLRRRNKVDSQLRES